MASPGTRNDARLWASITGELRTAGVAEPDKLARTVVAVVRRERAKNKARTWAPDESIPYEVTKVYDVDGSVWDRQSADPASTLRDSWKMRGFDPNRHESSCGGVWITPFLLDEWGPLTEVLRG